jgi:hypothetical protein
MKGSKSYPWQAAFVAYCNGTAENEIAQVFDIPFDSLKQHMSAEGWAALRTRLPLVTTRAGSENALSLRGTNGLPAEIEAKLAVIQENRTKNLAVFSDLRDRLIERLTAWKAGTLRIEKSWNNKGVVVTHEAAPGPGDWVNIATFAQTIAQGTYRALGDFQAQDKPGQDAVGGQLVAPQAQAITIILPVSVALPRAERGISEAQRGSVIDVSEVGVQGEAPQPPSEKKVP